MANGGFEIPVDIKPQVQDSGNTQKFFTDLANQGQAAINKVARAAGQPITQEIVFEAKDGQLQASVRNTSSLLKKMERAAEAARKKEQVEIAKTNRAEAAFRRRQIQDIEKARKAEAKRIADIEKRAKAARAAELKEIQKAVAEGQKYLEKERQVNMEIAKRKTLRAAGMTAQKGSLNAVQAELSLQQTRLANMKMGTAEYNKQAVAVKKLEGELNRMGAAGKQSGASIVSGFIKAQIAMAGLVAVMNQFRQVLGDTFDRGQAEQRFRNLTGSAAEYEQAMRLAKLASADFGITQTDATKSLSDLYSRLKAVGYGLTEVNTIYRGFNTVAMQAGVAGEEAAGAFFQLSQALGSGKLQGDELRSILERMPQLTALIAAEMGVAAGEIKRMGAEGKITGDVIYGAMRSAANGSADLTSYLTDTQIAMNNARQKAEDMRVALGEAIKPAYIATMNAFADAGQLLASAFKKIDQFMKDNKATLDVLLPALFEVGKVATAVFIVVKAYQAWAKAVAAVSAAKAALLAMSGPKGWAMILAGAGAAAGAYMGLNKVIDGAAKEIEALKNESEGALKKTREEADAASDSFKGAKQSVQELSSTMAASRPAVSGWSSSLEKAGNELVALAKKSNDSVQAQRTYEDAVERFTELTKEKIQAHRDEIEAIKEQISANKLSKEQGEKNIAAIEAEIESIEKKGKAFRKQAKRAKEDAQILKSAAKDVADAAKTAGDSWRDWTKSVSDSFVSTETAIKKAENLAAAVKKTSYGVNALGKDFGSTSNQAEMLEGALSDQLGELKGLQQNYARMVAMGYKLSNSQKQVMKDLNETTKAIEKQTAANDKKNASMRESVTIQSFSLGGGGSNHGKETVRWDMMSESEVQRELAERRRRRREKAGEAYLERQAQESMQRRQAYQQEMDAAYENFVKREENLTATRVNGINQVMQLTEQQERQRRQLFNSQYAVTNPFIPGAQREHGGPVSGGSTYTVNERGREGFMSASGRISEIKVPAWGQWKAPSSGEVIPAHVWSEMKAAGSSVSASGSSLASSGASSVVSHVRTHGDVDNSRVTNHVTIQSASPVQAASEVMVAAAKRRRRRFR